MAGLGHWAFGATDWHLMGVLLIGSLPGIVIGSYCAVRVPETVLRLTLAATLILVAGKLASTELDIGGNRHGLCREHLPLSGGLPGSFAGR